MWIQQLRHISSSSSSSQRSWDATHEQTNLNNLEATAQSPSKQKEQPTKTKGYIKIIKGNTNNRWIFKTQQRIHLSWRKTFCHQLQMYTYLDQQCQFCEETGSLSNKKLGKKENLTFVLHWITTPCIWTRPGPSPHKTWSSAEFVHHH